MVDKHNSAVHVPHIATYDHMPKVLPLGFAPWLSGGGEQGQDSGQGPSKSVDENAMTLFQRESLMF